MDDKSIKGVKSFEQIKQSDDDQEYWSARDLMPLLGYTTWENFSSVIGKAETACAKAGLTITDHFRKGTKMVEIGSNTVRPVVDYRLTRYACYLIAQNGDPRIAEIALAQSYFAVQTRKQEVGQQHLERITARHKLTKTEKEFASELMQRDIDGIGIGQIKSRGDKKLFTANTNEMKRRLGVPTNRPLADFLPTVTLKAKDLAAEITTFNTKRNNLRGVEPVAQEHEQNNTKVRSVLRDRGITPETLKPEEDIKKLERRINHEDKQLPQPAEKPLKINNPDGFDDTMGKISKQRYDSDLPF